MDCMKPKQFFVLMLTRWLLKAVGGIFVGMGLQGGEALELLTQVSTMIMGGLFFLIGIAISWFHKKYLAKLYPMKLVKDHLL